MILKKIEVENLLSHAHTVLELRADQKVLLDGKSGSGKSSIVEALIWCLYGHGRVDNRSLVKIGAKFAAVTVSLEEGEKSYNITRKISPKGKQEIWVTEKKDEKEGFLPVKVSGVKELQAFIEKEILHASYMLFINSIVYPQDNAENFVKQSAAGRKDILLEIVNASDYDLLYEKTKERLTIQDIRRMGAETSLSGKEKALIEDESLAKDAEKFEKEKIRKEVEVAEKKELWEKEAEKATAISMIKQELRNTEINEGYLLNRKNSVQTALQALGEKAREAEEFNTQKEEVDIRKGEAEIAAFREKQAAAAAWHEKMIELVKLSPVDSDYAKKKEELDKQILALSKRTVEDCPELNKPCPILVKQNQQRMNELEREKESLYMQEAEYHKQKAEYEANMERIGEKPLVPALQQIASLQNEIERKKRQLLNFSLDYQYRQEALGEKKKELEQIGKELQGVVDKITTLKLQLAMSEDNSEKFHKLREDLDFAENELSTARYEAMLSQTARERYDKNVKEKESLEKLVQEVQVDTENLRLLKEAFGNKGVKAMVIDYILPRLEEKINFILSQMSDFRVRIDTQKPGTKEDITLEGLFIDIINDQGEVLSYDSYSGGEKMKINMAIFEALASLSSIKFRVFDETFVALDQESGDQFLEVLEGIQQGISQMICISHMPSVKDFFPEKILVQKRNGESFISK